MTEFKEFDRNGDHLVMHKNGFRANFGNFGDFSGRGHWVGLDEGQPHGFWGKIWRESDFGGKKCFLGKQKRLFDSFWVKKSEMRER
jgi:hypothetical protein